MAELVEYCLVFLVSSLFVAGSVVTYDSFSAFASGLQLRAASSSVSRLAAEAVTDGSSSGAVNVPTTTIRCTDGVLVFASGGQTVQQGVGADCDFALGVPGGTHSFTFQYASQRLNLTVV